MDMQYLYILEPNRPEMLTSGPTPKEMEAIQGHVAYMEKLTAGGVLLIGGRTLNNDATTRGLALFVADSDAAAAEIMNNDPFVSSGAMTATLYPYQIAFGTLRASLP